MTYEFNLVLQSLLIAALWWLFAFVYSKYRLDVVRQRLFAIRDSLFQEAAQRDLFTQEAYGITRTTLNGMIRFAHEMSLSRIFFIVVLRRWSRSKEDAEAYIGRLMASLESISIDDRKLIMKAHAEAHLALMVHITRTSVVFWPIAFIVPPILSVLHLAKRASAHLTRGKYVRAKWAVLDAEANAIGEGLQTSSA
jgi:hypothetical protein